MQNTQPSITRIFCIGLNYVDHIKELANFTNATAIIFMKPASSAVWPGEQIQYPKHGKDFHHEVEIVTRVGKEGKPQTEKEALAYIDSLTVGLDLTLRDLQNDLRKKNLPWEISKSFDQSAALGDFVPYKESIDLNNISFGCKVNSVQRQQGNTNSMISNIPKLLVEVAKIWKLLPGDIIYTGTPSGVGSMNIGDTIEIESSITGSFSWKIVE
jgi:2-keto-4-pentenoate hydratase/2-oxohepta-3-ene-1,7-dioic acid hydratase in catechol pathway